MEVKEKSRWVLFQWSHLGQIARWAKREDYVHDTQYVVGIVDTLDEAIKWKCEIPPRSQSKTQLELPAETHEGTHWAS